MYFLGDTHGMRPVLSIIDKHKIENSNIIHVGDFGLGFVSIDQDLKNLYLIDEALMETNNHLYVVRGNHDNPIFWDRSKGLNLLKLHNLHLVDDYQVAKIEDKNILFVGGGISIDRLVRKSDKPYPTWWEDEVFKWSPEKMNRVANSIDKVDIVVTHSAPSFCYPVGTNAPIVNDWHDLELQHGYNLKSELEEERRQIDFLHDHIMARYQPTHWFYGHFHHSKLTKKGKVQYKLLNVNELYELV